MNNKIFGYDFEVFSKINWWCVSFIEKETQEITTIVNDKFKLLEFYENHKNDIFVGFNSRNYDVWILKGILDNINPSIINDQLIIQRKAGYQIVKNSNKYYFNNYDIGDIQHSLKQLEGFLGDLIKESDVDFNIDRQLTHDETIEIIKYNIHDVKECLRVLDYKYGDFDAQLSLIEAFELPFEMFNKTKAQLSAHILGAVKQHTFDDEFEITIPNTLKISEKYQYIIDWYKNPKNLSYKTPLFSYETGHKRSLDTLVAGIPHTFAWGGVHGAIPNYSAEGIILCADVASLYPSIMIEYGYLSRKITNPDKYKEIRDERLRLKALKDKRQQPYKIVLNSTYGILKDKNNALYDPLMSNNVCVTGQLLLLDLIEKVEPYGQLIQSNTDGIYMLVKNMELVETIKSVAKEWEQRTRLDLEWDIYNKIYQKDVNNYIIIDDKGHHKSKGAYLKKLSPIDNDLPIINTALIEYFVHNTPLEDTINNSNKLIDFQKIVKLTSLYKGVVYGEGIKEKQEDGKFKVKVINGEPLKEKVNRVFASINPHAKAIYKIKTEKGIEVYEKIAYTPDKCFINNEDINDISVPDELDRQYYIDLAKERLSQYLDSTEEKTNETPNVLYNCMLESKTFYDFLVLCIDKSPVKITTKAFTDYIIADCCNEYGKTQKLITFIEYFNLLYDKKSIKLDTLNKKINNEKVLKIIENNSEVNKSGKTYVINFEKALSEIFEIIPNEDILPQLIMEKQISLFEEVRYVNELINKNTYYILNMRNEIAPNIITYRINDGLIKNRKIDKQAFSILPVQDGDIIEVKSNEKRYGKKTIGKNSDGTNIVVEDTNKIYDVICSYDILYRDYDKCNKFDSDDGE